MSDLETRLRQELQSETAWHSADEMIGTVRRGSRRRQSRYRAGLGAAVAIALTAVGTTVWQAGRDQPPAAQHGTGTPVTQWSGPAGVAVTNAGVFVLTENVGCAACTTVWVRAGEGSWKRLHDFLPESPPPDPMGNGPVVAIRMAPDGRNGWVWGQQFWVTHDGGHTWHVDSPAVGGPDADPYSFSVLVGTHAAWTTALKDGIQSVWRSDVASDRWTQVPLPDHASALQAEDHRHFELQLDAVLPDDRAVITVGLGDDISTVISSSAGWTETELPSTPVPVEALGGGITVQQISLEDLIGTTAAGFTWMGPDGSTFGLAALGVSSPSDGSAVTADRWLFLHDGRAAVVDADGTHEVHLPVSGDDLGQIVTLGDVTWLVTEGHYLWASEDGGRTWSREEGP